MHQVTVIGAGLAGVEAALQLAARNVSVRLVEQKPLRSSPVHQSVHPAEIVCSNSLGSIKPETGPGILKAELACLDCQLLALARRCAVPAGHALTVDRDRFAAGAAELLDATANIERIVEECVAWPPGPAIIATGPVTSDAFQEVLRQRLEEELYFYDAVSPVVAADSIDLSKGFFGSRYDPEGTDYFNIPFTKDEYYTLTKALLEAETVPLSEFDKPLFFDACLPVEEIMRRGPDTLRFGPLKPVGFEHHFPRGERPWALLQLRRENLAGDSFNLVGFQTRMKQGEQRRVLRLIPGLENVEILRYGLVHRNFYLYSPGRLQADLSLQDETDIFFAGQMTGVEGYMESIATGLLAARHMERKLRGLPLLPPPAQSMLGGLTGHLTNPGTTRKNFRPMNANFSLVRMEKTRDKKAGRRQFGEQAVELIRQWAAEL